MFRKICFFFCFSCECGLWSKRVCIYQHTQLNQLNFAMKNLEFRIQAEAYKLTGSCEEFVSNLIQGHWYINRFVYFPPFRKSVKLVWHKIIWTIYSQNCWVVHEVKFVNIKSTTSLHNILKTGQTRTPRVCVR